MDFPSLPTPPQAHPQSLASILVRCRQQMGLSQSELAERIGPSWTARDIQLLEAERIVWPSWSRLLELAQALDIPLEVLTSAAGQTVHQNGHSPEPQAGHQNGHVPEPRAGHRKSDVSQHIK
jgi:transcriptional regulator with XRE-family HTH domain